MRRTQKAVVFRRGTGKVNGRKAEVGVKPSMCKMHKKKRGSPTWEHPVCYFLLWGPLVQITTLVRFYFNANPSYNNYFLKI